MNAIKILVVVFIATFLFISCQSDDDEPTIVEPSINFDLTSSPIDLQGMSASFAQDISYDEKDRTKLDIWMPESTIATGLVVYIHGGGFQSGDKTDVQIDIPGRDWLFTEDIRTFLSNKIAFASINYSLLSPFGQEEEGVIKSLNDAKRAIQFLKYNADAFNINKDKIVLAGNSAGGGASLWIAFNNNLADPGNADPVLQESTRVLGAAVRETQASYDIEGRWFNQVFEDYPDITFEVYKQASGNNLLQFYGLSSDEEYNLPAIDEYREDIDLLALFTSDDPPVWVSNVLRDVAAPTTGDLILHHPFHARELKERANELGVENVTSYGKGDDFVPDPSRPNESWVDFCIRIIER